MSDYKCPFTSPLASGFCQCQFAQEVVRRGGSEYDCTQAKSHSSCTALINHLNNTALPELGYEDDLTQTPKSIYDKVLIGGLQGLRIALNPADDDIETNDIWDVVKTYADTYPNIGNIQTDAFLDAIKRCKIKRRRTKK